MEDAAGPATLCPQIFCDPHYLLNKAPTLEPGIQSPSKTLAISAPSLPPFIPLSSQPMCVESLLDARHCSRDWECCGKQTLGHLQRSIGGRQRRQALFFYITLLGYHWRTINCIFKVYNLIGLTFVFTHETTTIMKIMNISTTPKSYLCLSIIHPFPSSHPKEPLIWKHFWCGSTSTTVRGSQSAGAGKPGQTSNLVRGGSWGDFLEEVRSKLESKGRVVWPGWHMGTIGH